MSIELRADPAPRGLAGLLRTAAAASLANISQRAFELGCDRGDIPVHVMQIGRLKYVRSTDLMAWLHPGSLPGAPVRAAGSAEPDLFN